MQVFDQKTFKYKFLSGAAVIEFTDIYNDIEIGASYMDHIGPLLEAEDRNEELRFVGISLE
jgi:hypothetical protein